MKKFHDYLQIIQERKEDIKEDISNSIKNDIDVDNKNDITSKENNKDIKK